jgi:hypothetical protein
MTCVGSTFLEKEDDANGADVEPELLWRFRDKIRNFLGQDDMSGFGDLTFRMLY